MNAPLSRADALLERWTAATARPVPAFAGDTRHRRRRGRVLALILASVVIAGAIVGTLAVGAILQRPDDRRPSAQLANAAARAIATAPGVRYALTIAPRSQDEAPATLNASGMIDFRRGRFSGSADGGDAGAPMLFFGGPARGAVIVADGLFVQAEGAPWVHVPDVSPQLMMLMDPVALSDAFKAVMDSSEVDPDVRFAPCASGTCRVISLSASAQGLDAAAKVMFGSAAQEPPPDLQPPSIELLIDPVSSFPVRMTTMLQAGPTTITVTLDATRLDPVPLVSPPIP